MWGKYGKFLGKHLQTHVDSQSEKPPVLFSSIAFRAADGSITMGRAGPPVSTPKSTSSSSSCSAGVVGGTTAAFTTARLGSPLAKALAKSQALSSTISSQGEVAPMSSNTDVVALPVDENQVDMMHFMPNI